MEDFNIIAPSKCPNCGNNEFRLWADKEGNLRAWRCYVCDEFVPLEVEK